MSTPHVKRYAVLGAILLIGTSALTLFQNCSKANFEQSADSLSLSSSGGQTTYALTKLNTPVAFTMKHSDVFRNVTLGFRMNEVHGAFTTLEADAARVQFMPEIGFRGRQEATVTVTDRYGSTFDLGAVIDVDNGFSAIEPALAVRGMGCLACHSAVASNLITDFGLAGDGRGNDFYFGGPSSKWNSGVYAAHGSQFSDWLLAAGRSIYVPPAALPADLVKATPAAKANLIRTLADFVKDQFASSANAGTRGVGIVQAQSIYIGAPTAAQIDGTLGLGGSRLKYYKNEASSPGLTGLVDRGTYFKNSGTLLCDGDVGLRGPLLLENLTVDTKKGCRLYVIGTVFIQGKITYANASADRNLQISSSRLISMGLGQTQRDGADCPDAGPYATKANGAPSGYGHDSFNARVKEHGTAYGFVTRESADVTKIAGDAVSDFQIVSRGEGAVMDAICLPGGRDVAFDRVFLNAPQVQSRYRGNVDGTIIAETALMALGNFKFTFDDVFNRVPVLPFFDRSVYLDVR